MKQLLLVGLGGFIGSVARFLVSKSKSFVGIFCSIPMGTLTVNVCWSFYYSGLLLVNIWTKC